MDLMFSRFVVCSLMLLLLVCTECCASSPTNDQGIEEDGGISGSSRSQKAPKSFDGVGGEAVVRTHSGSPIKLSLVRTRLLSASVEEATNRLFEISGFELTAPDGTRVDLRGVTGPPHLLVQRTVETRVTVNGQPMSNDDLKPAFIREGSTYTVAHMEDGYVVGIWAPYLALSPLDAVQCPGIFLNTARLTSSLEQPAAPFSLEGDEIDLNERSSGDSGDTAVTDERDGSGNKTNSSNIGAVSARSATSDPSSPLRIAHLPNCKSKSDCIIEDYKHFQRNFATSRQARAERCRRGIVTLELEIAAAADNTLCKAYGNSPSRTRAAVLAQIARANVPYRIQTCIWLTLRFLELHCNDPKDPYAFLRLIRDPDRTLRQFALFWNINRRSVRRDVAYFFPGYLDGTTVNGIASVGSVCNRRKAYGWVEGLTPFVIAHEIGHNLNCRHSTDGGIMNAIYTGSEVFLFSPSSLRTLFTFVDFRSPRCLQRRRQPRLSCAAAFNKRSAFRCSSAYFGYIYNTASPSIRVNVIKTQEYNTFRIILRSSTNVQIFRLAYLVTTREIIRRKELGRLTTFSNGGARALVIRVKTNQVKFPYSSNTCCGNYLFLHMFLRFCRRKTCTQGRVYLKQLVRCLSCGSSQRLIPMTSTRKCSRCVSA